MRSALLLPLLVLATGCYSVGFEPIEGLTEIAVPVFENQTLRREVEHDLTRLVRQEILEGTALNLAREGSADAILRGSVTGVTEQILVTGTAQEVLASTVTISASFGVYRGPRLIVGDDQDGDGRPDAPILLLGFAEFNAARGEDRQTATDEALRDLAEMIAYRLRDPWDDHLEPNDDAASAALIAPGRQTALRLRNPDWYRLEPPPRSFVRVRLEGGAGLSLSAHTADGARLESAVQRDADRVVEWVTGERSAPLLLQVIGPMEGASYILDVLVSDDDGAEPDSTPAEANPLPGGRTEWSVRGLQRDDDYVSVSLPQGLILEVELDATTSRVVICDDLGARRPDARHDPSGRSASLGPLPKSSKVLLRVEGDGAGEPYELRARLERP